MSCSRKVPVKIKEELIKEAGGKCANPGCPNTLTVFHHIHEWHVCLTHDKKTMIAICPACHHQVHWGSIRITDDTIYAWKAIKRPPDMRPVGQIYIEPQQPIKLLVGSMAVTGQKGAIILRFSKNQKLSFKVIDNDLCSLNISVSDLDDQKVIRITDNYVKEYQTNKIHYEKRTGKITLKTFNIQQFIPDWLLQEILKFYPEYEKNLPFTLFDLEVVKPGMVKVQGVWSTSNQAIVITQDQIIFSPHPTIGPTVAIKGMGENTIINCVGPLTIPLFNPASLKCG